MAGSLWDPGAIATEGLLLLCLVVLSHHPEWNHFNKNSGAPPPHTPPPIFFLGGTAQDTAFALNPPSFPPRGLAGQMI